VLGQPHPHGLSEQQPAHKSSDQGEPKGRIAEFEHRIQLGPARYHLRRPGDLLHPQREPQVVLDEFKQSMGSLDLAAQYQQEPVAEGGNLSGPRARFLIAPV
jgi:hypothetical protein